MRKEEVRLNKFVADCTGISRRQADKLIAEGKIKVNRKPGETGQVIDALTAFVILDGVKLEPQRKKVLLLHKPKDTITTKTDPEGRKTVYDLLPQALHNLDPVGRLDRDTTGVLLLTNDGELLQQLTHPKFAHNRVYTVSVTKTLTDQAIALLQKGVMLQPENKLAETKILEMRDKRTLVVSLQTGMNRQIRRTFEAIGYEIKTLKRTSFAGITLGDLAPGKHRMLLPHEVRKLSPATKGRPTSRNKTNYKKKHQV